MHVSDIFTPEVSHRFMTSFIFKGIPSPLDLSFQRIQGLSREMAVTPVDIGGENYRTTYTADKITHGSLILERGVMALTPLTMMFDQILSGNTRMYADVVILLLNHRSLPVCSWTLDNALPVRWQTGDLDANSNNVLINTLELRYQDMSWLGSKV